jgi:hypothetical protein
MTPEHLIDTFGTPEKPKTGKIDKACVMEWADSADINVLGVLYGYLSNASYFERVTPSLRPQEFLQFSLKYFARCIIENASSKYADSRYEATWELVSVFLSFWNSDERVHCSTIKSWLAEQYKHGDDEVRRSLVDGTLEHLFENAEAREFFFDWKKDQALAIAYEEANEWVKKGGKSPLS